MNTNQMLTKVVNLVGNDYITNPQYLDVEEGQAVTFYGKSAPDTYGGDSLTFVRTDNGNGINTATWKAVKPPKVKRTKAIVPPRTGHFFDVDAE